MSTTEIDELDPRYHRLNPSDLTVGEKLPSVQAYCESHFPEVADAARAWCQQIQQLLADGEIEEVDGISEICLERDSTIGAAEARLHRALMDAAATDKNEGA